MLQQLTIELLGTHTAAAAMHCVRSLNMLPPMTRCYRCAQSSIEQGGRLEQRVLGMQLSYASSTCRHSADIIIAVPCCCALLCRRPGGYFVAIMLVFLGSLVGLRLPGLFSGGEGAAERRCEACCART